MTIAEHKEACARQFEELTRRIAQLGEELQQTLAAREQVRGRYALACELEQNQATAELAPIG